MQKGLIAEFATPEDMLRAIEELKRRGYRELDAFSPYPLHGLERAVGLRRSRLGWIVFPIALAAAAGGYLIQWWCNGIDYPLNVGGRPPHSAPAFIPITFEMTVLATSLAGLLVFFVLARIPRLYSPLFEVEGFERASLDRFWIGIDARDPALAKGRAERDLEELGAIRIARLGEEGP
jgi:hypothetical protein